VVQKRLLPLRRKSSCDIMQAVCQLQAKKSQEVNMKIDTNSLSHTTWNCKYHIVFAPKYRRQVIYGKIKKDIGDILRKLCEWKGVEIIEAEACPDHIHMLVSIPPKISVSSFMGYLKGKSSLMIFDRHANMKYKYGNREFWCRGYYVDTVGKNKKAIAAYIRNQLQEDVANDQIRLKEYVDPFTGEPVKPSDKK
jgi:putative transposase